MWIFLLVPVAVAGFWIYREVLGPLGVSSGWALVILFAVWNLAALALTVWVIRSGEKTRRNSPAPKPKPKARRRR